MEVIVRKQEQDTTMQINILENPCPPCPCPTEEEPQPKPKKTFNKYSKTDGFAGIGFIVPDGCSSNYTTLGGNSINVDVGGYRRYHLSRRFALGTTLNYSYYNYKLDLDNDDDLKFKEIVLKEGDGFDDADIKKQVFRSHNIAAGVFTRFYITPPKHCGNDGLYIDIGAQGDFAPFRYYMEKSVKGNKEHGKKDSAFEPFTASAIARIGGWKHSDAALFIRYRFTNAFSKPLEKDLPRLTIGVHFF
jgi:hypothetical protein